ncbi:MAG: nuclear transport factor 2 family protein [Dermatophilaceae bacterium]
MSNIAVHDVLANDEHVIALINVALRKPDGSEVAYPAIEVAHMSNGLIADGCPRDGPSSSRVLLM